MAQRNEEDILDVKEAEVTEDVLEGLLEQEGEEEDPLMKVDSEDDKGWE